MFLSSLFVFLSIATAQPVADVPVQVTQHVSTTRYQFEYQENEHIIDLSAKLKILAYYINNELQNPSLLPSTQKELLRYDEKSKLDLLETFDVMQSRTPRPPEMTTEQSVADIPVQVTEHISFTRYQFKYQENEYIIDLSAKLKILAYYINNELQNPSLSSLTQKVLLQYDDKSNLDLSETFDYFPKRNRRVKRRGSVWYMRRGGRRQSRTRQRTETQQRRWRWTRGWARERGRERARIRRKNNPRSSTKTDLGATGDRLMTVGRTLMMTGFPPVVTVGKVLAVLGFFTWVSGELFD